MPTMNKEPYLQCHYLGTELFWDYEAYCHAHRWEQESFDTKNGKQHWYSWAQYCKLRLPQIPLKSDKLGYLYYDYDAIVVDTATIEKKTNEAIQAILNKIRAHPYNLIIMAKYQHASMEKFMRLAPELKERMLYQSSVDAVNLNNMPIGPNLRVYLFKGD